jgi:hypothetical protein
MIKQVKLENTSIALRKCIKRKSIEYSTEEQQERGILMRRAEDLRGMM